MIQSEYKELEEIKTLVDQFVTKTLPAKAWTHHTHLTVGLWYVSKFGKQEASGQMPNLIKKYNEAIGKKNNDVSGYHETITQYWIWLLDCYWQQVHEKMSLVNACNYLITSSFGNPTSYFTFYSKEKIFSVEARERFIEPDLQSLDSRFLDYNH